MDIVAVVAPCSLSPRADGAHEHAMYAIAWRDAAGRISARRSPMLWMRHVSPSKEAAIALNQSLRDRAFALTLAPSATHAGEYDLVRFTPRSDDELVRTASAYIAQRDASMPRPRVVSVAGLGELVGDGDVYSCERSSPAGKRYRVALRACRGDAVEDLADALAAVSQFEAQEALVWERAVVGARSLWRGAWETTGDQLRRSAAAFFGMASQARDRDRVARRLTLRALRWSTDKPERFAITFDADEMFAAHELCVRFVGGSITEVGLF